MKAAAERDAHARLEGNKNLIAAAQQTGVRRFLVQSTGFWYAPGGGWLTKANPSPTVLPQPLPQVRSGTPSSRL
jgi:nucleoside-diphosphate-sugar epimerase